MTSRTPQLSRVQVGDCMHRGILSCSDDAPLGEVAGIMAAHRVHAVAVTNGHGSRPIAIVSDLDVVLAASSGEELTALQAAGTEPVTIAANEALERAAQLMAEHSVSHLVVLDPASGYPIGVLSTLDLASAYARAER